MAPIRRGDTYTLGVAASSLEPQKNGVPPSGCIGWHPAPVHTDVIDDVVSFDDTDASDGGGPGRSNTTRASLLEGNSRLPSQQQPATRLSHPAWRTNGTQRSLYTWADVYGDGGRRRREPEEAGGSVFKVPDQASGLIVVVDRSTALHGSGVSQRGLQSS